MSWQRIIQRALTTATILAVAYLLYVFIGRALEPKLARSKPAARPLSPDYYVYPPKSYVRDFASARALAGKPLWVREGYRWGCTPGPETLGPMEKLTPKRVFRRGGQVWLEFTRDGKACEVAVSSGDTFVVDEIFLIQDPREVYKDWPPEAWKKIAERRAEAGMTETQINFALGYGALVRELSQPGDAHRVVDHVGGPQRARVVYEYGVAKQVTALPAP